MQHLQPGVPHVTPEIARQYELADDSSYFKAAAEIAARPEERQFHEDEGEEYEEYDEDYNEEEQQEHEHSSSRASMNQHVEQ
jgi:hypothetical protein